MRSHQFSQGIDNNLDFLEDVQNESLVVGSVRIERSVSLRRLVLESNLKSNQTLRVELDVRIGYRNLKEANYRSVLNIPFVYVEGRRLLPPILAYEIYFDEGWRSDNDSKNLMLIPIGKFCQDAQEGRDFWIRTAIEGLKTKDRISYSIGNTDKFAPTPIVEIFEGIGNDESRLVTFVYPGTGREMRDSENQVIERVSQVGNTVAYDESPPLKVGDDTNSPDPKPIFGVLIVTLEDKFVRVSIKPCRDFAIDDFEVVARPS